MSPDKRKALQDAGWRFGDVDDFLGSEKARQTCQMLHEEERAVAMKRLREQQSRRPEAKRAARDLGTRLLSGMHAVVLGILVLCIVLLAGWRPYDKWTIPLATGCLLMAQNSCFAIHKLSREKRP